VPVKLGFIILSIIGVLRIPGEFYLYKEKYMYSTWFLCTNDVRVILCTIGEIYTGGDTDLWNTHSHCSCYPVHDMWQNFCFLPWPSPEIDNGGRIKTKLYDKHIGFTFPIVNSPFISSNILVSPAHGVCISQLICYSRACSQSSNLLDRAQLLTKQLLKQGFVAPRLKSSLQKLYGRHHNLLDIHISKDNGSSTFYIDVLFPLSLPRFLLDWTVYMSYSMGVL
jgi:hypothetical protein